MKKRLQTTRWSSFIFLIIVLTSSFFYCGKKQQFETYFPETGDAAIRQRALNLRNNLNVMSIALEPGFEDLSALAYFKFEQGANILSAYLTNGEAGDADDLARYPNYLAADRRMEAADALYYLGGEIHFLNFPHVVAARDSAVIREKWVRFNVEKKIRELINQFKPDIILLGRDWYTNDRSLRWRLFRQDVISAVKTLEKAAVKPDEKDVWLPARILVDDPGAPGEKLPVDLIHPIFKKSYSRIAGEAAAIYKSLSVQYPAWREGKSESYSIIYPDTDLKLDRLVEKLPPRNTRKLQSLAAKINSLTGNLLKGKSGSALTNLVSVLDSVNHRLATRFDLSDLDQRALFHWKRALEELQCSLLGIKVKYSTDENVLTNVQLIRITLNEVEGFEINKNTSVFFGGLGQKWIINETKERRQRLRLGDEYRLISPEELDYTTPQAKYGLQLARVDKPITLMVLHEAPTREKSFVYRTPIKLYFAPKFTTEVLTPVVKMIPGEKLILRLTNHSRDGVRDTVRAAGDLADSVPGLFRLNQKESSYLDSLTLIWKEYPEPGTYKVPVKIGDMEVGRFAVRHFQVNVDQDKKIGVLPSLTGSPLPPTMVRLGVKYEVIHPEQNLADQLNRLDVLIIDQRALTLLENLTLEKETLLQFVRNGGHLIFLAQDAAAWNDSQIWADVTLAATQEFDESYPVTVENAHPFLTTPNKIEQGDWKEWLYRRAYNLIRLNSEEGIQVPVRAAQNKSPLVVTKPVGNGRITYVDLALSPQLLNIHPGVFVLLANIISI